MKFITGETTDHLIVEAPTTVTGSVSAGATVRTGQNLIVNGTLAGPLTVEADAFCTVYGMFSGTIEPGEGLAMLHGMVNTPPSHAQGKFAVGIDSLIRQEDGSLCTLRRDGTLEEVIGDVKAGNHTVNADELCVYVSRDRMFMPVPINKPRT